jgi:hypothetical protein
VVRDAFSEDPLEFRYNGRRAAFIDVYRVGEQSALEVAAARCATMSPAPPDWLPPGVELRLLARPVAGGHRRASTR